MSNFLHTDSAEDLFNFIAGAEIGRGQYRVVYEHAFDKKLVIKQDSGENFSNLNEWMLYQEFKDTVLGKWMAPVLQCSPRGMWIIQARTTPIKKGKFPKRVPELFADVKPSNWGMYRGRPVCHDFGNHRLYTVGIAPASKLRSAVWAV